MKEIKRFGFCEYCNATIDMISPLPKEQYELGRI